MATRTVLTDANGRTLHADGGPLPADLRSSLQAIDVPSITPAGQREHVRRLISAARALARTRRGATAADQPDGPSPIAPITAGMWTVDATTDPGAAGPAVLVTAVIDDAYVGWAVDTNTGGVSPAAGPVTQLAAAEPAAEDVAVATAKGLLQ